MTDFTDVSGTVKLFMPAGAYRFSAAFMGDSHWSGAEGHCTTPGCETAQINIPKPVTVTVLYENGDPYPDVDVRAFIGETPSGYTAVSTPEFRIGQSFSNRNYIYESFREE